MTDAGENMAAALTELARAGRRPPCATDPGRWVSDDIATRRQAAHDCQPCPVLAACDAMADALGTRWGVWGGRDRSPRPTKRSQPKVETTNDRSTNSTPPRGRGTSITPAL